MTKWTEYLCAICLLAFIYSLCVALWCLIDDSVQQFSYLLVSYLVLHVFALDSLLSYFVVPIYSYSICCK